jgi:hypothetical protein
VNEEGIGAAGAVDLAWDPPETDAVGDPLTDPAGYVIHFGPSSGFYERTIDVGNVTECAVALPLGTWYLAVTAYNVQGNEGPYSNEIVVVLNGSVTQLEGLSPLRLSFTGAASSRGGPPSPSRPFPFRPPAHRSA